MGKYTQRKPHYVDLAADHALGTIPTHGWLPVYLSATTCELAAAETGKFATAVCTEIISTRRVGLFFDGVLFTPSTPLTPRTTLWLSKTAGGVEDAETTGARQALGETLDAHHTSIAIHQPTGEGELPLTYNTRDERPVPNTLKGGQLVTVCNDGANDGAYLVLGPAGGTGTGYLRL